MGGLHFLFHNDSGQEDVKTGIMVYDPNVQGGYKDKVLERLDWLGHASTFFNNTISYLDSMAAHNELISSAEDTYCLANPGVEYAVYSWSGKSFGLDLSAAAGKTLSVRFYNPRNGQWTEPARFKADGIEKFEKPDSEDWAFHVRIE
jgi:hypothetical protein